MAKREILTTRVKKHLDNFTEAMGVKLGKLIKQCIDGSLSSSGRIAFQDDFLSDGTLDATKWTVKDTSAAGSPTAAITNDAARGIFGMKLAANDEAEILTLYANDNLQFDVDDKPFFEAIVSYEGTAAVASAAVFGLASAQNDNPDSVAAAALFKIVDDGTDTTLVIESDDGTNNNDDVASGITLTEDTYYTFKIDMKNLSDVKFYVNNQQVAKDYVFDMSNYSDNLQPYFCLLKASGISQAALDVDFVRVECNRS